MSTPFVLESDMTVYVDIDSTLVEPYKQGDPTEELVYFEEVAFKVLEKNVEYVRESHARGHAIIFWSAGGWAWAETVVTELDIKHLGSAIISKPRWIVDDLPASQFIPESIRVFKE